jgi:hypothetical protein
MIFSLCDNINSIIPPSILSFDTLHRNDVFGIYQTEYFFALLKWNKRAI